MIGLELCVPLLLGLVRAGRPAARAPRRRAHRGAGAHRRPRPRRAFAKARGPTSSSSTRATRWTVDPARLRDEEPQHAVRGPSRRRARRDDGVRGPRRVRSRGADVSDPTKQERAWLVLADGTVFEGRPFGARGDDDRRSRLHHGDDRLPGGAHRPLVLRADRHDDRARDRQRRRQRRRHGGGRRTRPRVAGFVVRDASPIASNWRATESLDAYLARHGVVGIADVDTRKLTRHLRDHGSQNARHRRPTPPEALAATRARGARHERPRPRARSHAEGAVHVDRGPRRMGHEPAPRAAGASRRRLRLRHRSATSCAASSTAGCRLTVVPAGDDRAPRRSRCSPDGVFLSNGPGDPAAVTYAVDTVRALLGKKPLFGICLGHQLLALALGAKTYKLKFGHRGANQPVKDLATGRVEITTQNHGFCVDLVDLPAGVASTHVHLNDGTSEGLAAPSAARLQRAVPPRGRGRPARRALPVRAVRRGDARPALTRGLRVVRVGQGTGRVLHRRTPQCARSTSSASAARRTASTPRSCSASPPASGWRIVDEADEAEVIVVNTCGFIGEAKKESIDTILELAEYKRVGACKKLVVAGCLSQRYPGELAAQMPEVDHFLGSSDMLKLASVLAGERRADARRQPGGLGRARQRSARRHAVARQRLAEDRRGLQPDVRVLRDPEDPRQAALAHGRRRRRGGRAPRRWRRDRAEPRVAGHRRLRAATSRRRRASGSRSSCAASPT